MAVKELSIDYPAFVVKGEGKDAIEALVRDILDFRRDLVDVSQDHATILGDIIRSDTTINVPADFVDIRAAWDYLKTKILLGNVTVIIDVADGTYDDGDVFIPHHPQGSQIAAIGNQSNPENCILNFTHGGSTDGIRLDLGHCLGFFDGFTVRLPAKAEWPNGGSGIKVFNNAHFNGGENVIIENFYYGAFATDNASIKDNKWVVRKAGDVGLFAFCGGFMSAIEASVADTVDAIRGLGTGILAEHNGTIDCPGAFADGSHLWDVAAVNNGHIRVTSADFPTPSSAVEPFLQFFNDRISVTSPNSVQDIILDAKGSGGLIQLDTTFIADTGITVGGYVSVRDRNGTAIDLMVKSS